VVAAVAALNRLELAGESVRAVLEALAAASPDWLAQRVCVPDFTRRYGTPATSWRPPLSEAKRDELAVGYARDGYALLEAVYDGSSPAWLRRSPRSRCCAGCCCRTTPDHHQQRAGGDQTAGEGA
jgi:hypothetical protein